eukprot:TRINITY_DN3832_c0_g1_i1.p1 TRINITY_DN3832_c0_g1~~TRINITY_DN3832_c0_g1_i1.p1  ORF type:complete len:354 (+),score=34.50 TRINITY_DN3832_c0_g1_i1:143-1204(+)
MMKIFFVIILALHLCFNVLGQKALVSVPVSDLRAKPQRAAFSYQIDYNQLTQLLYNEPVKVLDVQGDWSYVSAVLQPSLVNNTLVGYLGWIQSSHLTPVDNFPNYNIVVKQHYANVYKRNCYPFGCLPTDILVKVSLGTFFEGLVDGNGFWKIILPPPYNIGYILSSSVGPIVYEKELFAAVTNVKDDDIRSGIIETGKTLLGVYYFWGGRSALSADLFTEEQTTGTDCSGFVSLSYKANGIILPRDASVIFTVVHNVTVGPTGLQPADLLFFADSSNPFHMTHVMMVLDDNHLMEATVDTKNYNGTRLTTYQDRFGADLKDLQWGKRAPAGSDLVYWGTVFPLGGLKRTSQI